MNDVLKRALEAKESQRAKSRAKPFIEKLGAIERMRERRKQLVGSRTDPSKRRSPGR